MPRWGASTTWCRLVIHLNKLFMPPLSKRAGNYDCVRQFCQIDDDVLACRYASLMFAPIPEATPEAATKVLRQQVSAAKLDPTLKTVDDVTTQMELLDTLPDASAFKQQHGNGTALLSKAVPGCCSASAIRPLLQDAQRLLMSVCTLFLSGFSSACM